MSQPESVVERVDVAVMLRRVPDEVPAIRQAWSELEHALGSLTGRKFYGSFDPTTDRYAVCVVLREGDDPRAFGLEPGTLPGGRYVRARLTGEPPALYDRIPATMRRLADRSDRDPTRPQLEFYRRRDEVDLLVPVVSSS